MSVTTTCAILIVLSMPAVGAEMKLEDVNLADGLAAREAVTLALRQNPGIIALRKAYDVANAAVWRAKALPDPELRFGWSDSEEPLSRRTEYDVSMRWSPPRLRERSLKGNLAAAEASETGGEVALAEQQLAAEVLLLHATVVILDEQIAAAEASVKVREEMVELIEKQVAAEVKSLLDLNVAQLALADARSLPKVYRAERLVSMSRLIAQLNLPRFARLELQRAPDPLQLRPRPIAIEELVERALSGRAELAGAEARCSQAQAALSLAKEERYPWFSFFQVGRQFGVGAARDSFGFRAGIDLPIFKWSGGILEQPLAAMERCRLDQESLKEKITMEVEQLASRLDMRYREAEHLQQTVEPMALRDRSLSEQAVAAGQLDQVQYLAAEARRLQRRQSYLSELLECRRLEVELDLATGDAAPSARRGVGGQAP
jgi:outer membrane protein TolC